MEDTRFKDAGLMNVISNSMPHYDLALTIKYHESEEAKEKIALSPLNCYATFPINDVGSEYDDVRFNSLFSMPEFIQPWENKDWSVGVPHPVSDANTYKIFKKYEKYVIKEKE